MTKKNNELFAEIYECIGIGMPQYEILKALHKKGFKLGKSRLSQIIKYFVKNKYIRCHLYTNYKQYIILPKKYETDRRNIKSSRWGRKTLRVHNHRFKLKVNESFILDISMWDSVSDMKNGVKQYIYHGHNDDGPVTVQRIKGKNSDTILLIFPDLDWNYMTLDEHDQYIWRKAYGALKMIEKHFKMEAEITGKMKWTYAIRPAPFPELQQAFQKDNYKVGDWEGDASKDGIPELETVDRNKVIALMEIMNNAPEILRELIEKRTNRQSYIQ
jgi:hypothetical protein